MRISDWSSDVCSSDLDSLPLAALVLRRLLKALELKEVIYSANGLREGIAYAMLDERQRSEDPMLASCIHMAMRESRFGAHGKEIDSFIAPLFERDSPAQQSLRLAASILFDEIGRASCRESGGQYV